MSGWWGWLLRRVVLAPLMPVLLLAYLVWLLVLAGSDVLCPLLAAVRRERPRVRALRVASTALASCAVGACSGGAEALRSRPHGAWFEMPLTVLQGRCCGCCCVEDESDADQQPGA